MSAYVPNTDPNAWPQLPVFKPSWFTPKTTLTVKYLDQQRRCQHEFASVLPDVSWSIPACVNSLLASARSCDLPGQPLWLYARLDAAGLVLLNQIGGDVHYIVTVEFARVGSCLHMSMKGHLGYYLPWGTIAHRMSSRLRLFGLWLILLCLGILPLRLGLPDVLLVYTGASAFMACMNLRIDHGNSSVLFWRRIKFILGRMIGPGLAAVVGVGLAFAAAKQPGLAQWFTVQPLSYMGPLGAAVSAYYLLHTGLASVNCVGTLRGLDTFQTTGFFQTVQELLFRKVG